jgi:uncharacterized integral membrane protein (TIGR00697 family)
MTKHITVSRFLDVVAIVYIVLIVTANVMASKVLAIRLLPLGSIIIDAGTLTYPLTFMIGDILAEIYGYKAARRIILWGFAANLLFSALAWVGTLFPPLDAAAGLTTAYDVLFSYNIRILGASFVGYIVGSLLNAASLLWIRQRTGTKWLALRTIGSTAFGAAADTALFTLIAWLGTLPPREMLVMGVSGYAVKMVYETLIATPLDYFLTPLIKRHVRD